MSPQQEFVDPEDVLREALKQEIARLEAQYADRRSWRDRSGLRRAKRRATWAYRRGRLLAKW